MVLLDEEIYTKNVEMVLAMAVLHAIPPNKASGLNNVCTKLIKYGSKAVAPILCKIFNMCLKQGSVPDELKVAREFI